MRRLLSLPLLALTTLTLLTPTPFTLTPHVAAQEAPPEGQEQPSAPSAPGLDFGSGFGSDLSFWLESGLAYRSRDDNLTPHLRVGVRALKPLSETVSLYTALATDGGLGVNLDAGAWYNFLPDTDDLFGFHAYAGAGLSYVSGSFGLALSAAASYELSAQTSLVLVYTHRPLFVPEEGQAFDVSLGVSYSLAQ